MRVIMKSLLVPLLILSLTMRAVGDSGRGEDLEEEEQPTASQLPEGPLCLETADKRQTCINKEQLKTVVGASSFTTLTVRNATLDQLPASLRRFPRLTAVHLLDCSATSLPSSMLRGLQLRRFFLGRSATISLPEEFCASFGSLRSLSLLDTQMQRLPECALPASLTQLALALNARLGALPDASMTALASVGLDHSSYRMLHSASSPFHKRLPVLRHLSFYTDASRPRMPASLASLRLVKLQRLQGIASSADPECSGIASSLPAMCFEREYKELLKRLEEITADPGHQQALASFIGELLAEFRLEELFRLTAEQMDSEDASVAEALVIAAASQQQHGLNLGAILGFPFAEPSTRTKIQELIQEQQKEEL